MASLTRNFWENKRWKKTDGLKKIGKCEEGKFKIR